MMVLAFTRSGPGVLDVFDEMPTEWRMVDSARLPTWAAGWLSESSPTSHALPIRRFRLQCYAMPGDFFDLVRHDFVRWGVPIEQIRHQQRWVLTVPVYVEQS